MCDQYQKMRVQLPKVRFHSFSLRNSAFKREFLHPGTAYIGIVDALFESTSSRAFLKFREVILWKILPPRNAMTRDYSKEILFAD